MAIPKTIYLDYAAATPLDPGIFKKMLPFYTQKFYNPSAIYLAGKEVSREISEARSSVAKTLGAKPFEIIYTAGATEANNLAIFGILEKYPKNEIIISAIEHDSVLESSKKYPHKLIKVSKDGRVNLVDLKKAINDRTVLVSIMLANNEIGTIMPLRKISNLISEIRKNRILNGNKTPLYLHTDASQAPLFIDLHVGRIGIDLMSINGGKIYGPKQSGCLYIRTGIELSPLIKGGGQERGLRSGTENVPNIIGFSEALVQAQQNHKSHSTKLLELRSYFLDNLIKKIPDIIINGSIDYRLPNNIHITIPKIDNERVMMELDEKGIQCAVGSACSASSDEPSHVLKAIGLTDEQAQSSLRFSLGKTTSKKDLDYVVDNLSKLLS